MITIRRIAAAGLTLVALGCLAVPAQAAPAPPTTPPVSTITTPLPDSLSTGQHRSVEVPDADQIVILSCQPTTTTRPGWSVPVMVVPADHGVPEHASADVPGVDVTGLYGAGLGWPFEVVTYLHSHLTGRSGCIVDLGSLPASKWGAFATLGGGPGLSVPAGAAEAILPGAATTPRPASPVSTDRTAPPSASPSANTCNPSGGLGACIQIVTPDTPAAENTPAASPTSSTATPPARVSRADSTSASRSALWQGSLIGSLLTVAGLAMALWVIGWANKRRADEQTRRGKLSSGAVLVGALALALSGLGQFGGIAAYLVVPLLMPVLAVAAAKWLTEASGHDLTLPGLAREVANHGRWSVAGGLAGYMVGALVDDVVNGLSTVRPINPLALGVAEVGLLLAAIAPALRSARDRADVDYRAAQLVARALGKAGFAKPLHEGTINLQRHHDGSWVVVNPPAEVQEAASDSAAFAVRLGQLGLMPGRADEFVVEAVLADDAARETAKNLTESGGQVERVEVFEDATTQPRSTVAPSSDVISLDKQTVADPVDHWRKALTK